MDEGVVGGIGAGIDSFLNSYRAERNYQDEKKNKAMELAIKQRLADAEAAKAYGQVLGEGGSDAANPLRGKLGLIDTSGVRFSATEPQQAQIDQGPIQYPDQGAPQGLIQGQQAMGDPQAQQPPSGLLSAQKSGQSETYIPSKLERSQNFSLAEKGYSRNRKTGEIEYAPGPMGDAARLAAEKNQVELNNLKSGQRSAQETAQKEFNNHPSVAAARQSKVYMDQMLQSQKDPSPQGQASLFLNALRIKFPTAPDVGSLEELSKSESAPVQMRNAAYKYLNGTMDQQVIDDLVRDGISTFESNAGGFKSAQKDYQDKVVNQYGLNTKQAKLVTRDSGIDDTLARALAMKEQMGPYKGPADRGGISGKVLGLLHRSNSAVAAPPAPKIGAVVKGYKYLGGDPSKPSSWGKQ